jgi:hypothetical protein
VNLNIRTEKHVLCDGRVDHHYETIQFNKEDLLNLVKEKMGLSSDDGTLEIVRIELDSEPEEPECQHRRTYLSDLREYCEDCGESWWAKTDG